MLEWLYRPIFRRISSLERRMTKLVDDLVFAVGEIAAAVDALEVVVTDLKSKIADPDDVAKLEGALAGLKAAVADAADGTDEAAPAP